MLAQGGHEATDTGLAYAPVSQAHGHHHSVQCFNKCLAALQRWPVQYHSRWFAFARGLPTYPGQLAPTTLPQCRLVSNSRSAGLSLPQGGGGYNGMLAMIATRAWVNTTFVAIVAKLPRSRITWFHTLNRAGRKLPVQVLGAAPQEARDGEQQRARGCHSPQLGIQQYFGWILKDENGIVSCWHPVTIRCPGAIYGPSGIPCCTWILGGYSDLYNLDKSRSTSVQHPTIFV